MESCLDLVYWIVISSFQDLDAKILQTASQKQIMNDKKRREAFKKILSDVIGVGIVLIIVFFPEMGTLILINVI